VEHDHSGLNCLACYYGEPSQWRADELAETVTLQKRAASWHSARFPWANEEHVVLKALTELGEVADALIAKNGQDSATGKPGEGVTGEAADVVIALMVLVGRWEKEDLLEAVGKKLSVLETPGAHKASRMGPAE
jgi:hypothetical protein